MAQAGANAGLRPFFYPFHQFADFAEANAMIRSLCALAALLVTCAVLAAPAPRPFESGWGNPVDPGKDCKIRRESASLTIEIPDSDHDYDPIRKQFNAPRLLRDMEGNFQIQVRVRIDRRPSAQSTVKGQPSCVSAGFLLIYPGAGRYICDRYEYGISQPGIGLDGYAVKPIFLGEQKNVKSRKGIGEDGYIVMKNWDCRQRKLDMKWDRESPRLYHIMCDRGWDLWPLPKKSNYAYMRLELQQRSFNFYISADGEKWTEMLKLLGPPTKLKLGLAAFSTSSEPSKVRFDHLKLTRGQKKKR